MFSMLEQLQQIGLFFSSFSPYREIPFLNFNIYERSAPADWFSPFSIWKRRCDISSFYWGLERNYCGLIKNKKKREMKNQSAGVSFFNINPLYWEKVKKEKKIHQLEFALTWLTDWPALYLYELHKSSMRQGTKREDLDNATPKQPREGSCCLAREC